MSNNGAVPVSADGIKYPQPLSTAALQSSSKCTVFLAGGALGGGVLHTYRPPRLRLPTRAPRPVLAHSSFTVKTLSVVCIIYFFLFIYIFFSTSADVVFVLGTVVNLFSIHSFTVWFKPHEVEGLQIDYKST